MKNRNDLIAWIALNVPCANLTASSIGESATWFVACAEARGMLDSFDTKDLATFLLTCEGITKDIEKYTEGFLAYYPGTKEDLVDDLKKHFGL